jgi:predicted nucleic acid-binding protein
MISPAWGPFLFDTSAESWLVRSPKSAVRSWFGEYLSLHRVHVSAITIAERIRGYAILAQRAKGEQPKGIEAARIAYLGDLGQVWPLDRVSGVVAGEIMALLPQPATPARRTHRLVESRQDRLVRWRFDAMIAAMALVAGMALIHNNPSDFESIRSAIEISP